MPLLAFRAKQTTATAGTGTLTLVAATAVTRGFQAAFGASPVPVRYVISNATQYELGIGTFDGGSPGTLTRDTVLASSNAGALVSLPAGTADVFAWIEPRDRRVIESAAASVTLSAADLGNALIWSGSSAGTLNLPALAGVPVGAAVEVVNIGTATLTVDPAGAELVDGAATLAIGASFSATLIRLPGGWRAMGLQRFVLPAGNLTVNGNATVTGALSAGSISTGGGQFTAVNVTGSGIGSTGLLPGMADRPGYIEWRTAGGVRAAYLGWSNGGTRLEFDVENGWTLNLDTGTTLNGGAINHSAMAHSELGQYAYARDVNAGSADYNSTRAGSN
jgi:hypothetical protein